MASGQKIERLNFRERIVSNDWMRMQAFIGAQIADSYKWLFSAVCGEGGFPASIITTTNPMWGVVLNGICARPEIGTINMFVEPGAVVIANPDTVPSADDSPIKVINDAGVQLAGALTLTAGAGSTRIDILECSRVEVDVESDNRDIFDPVTGLFTPTSVPKVTANQLQYRIRNGTAGGGFASVSTVSGWMPIAVMSVPNTATTWDDCTVWDVRRLMSDMVRAPAQVTQKFPYRRKAWATCHEVGGVRTARGVIETELDQFRVGGELGSSSSGLANGALDLQAANVLEPGFVVANSLPWLLYLLFPFGLPRWAKFTPASAGFRIPDALKGIPVFTQKSVVNHGGGPGVAVSLPTGTGLGGSTTKGVVALSGAFEAGGVFISCVEADNWVKLATQPATVSPAAGAGTGSVRYDLLDNTHWPLGATAVRLQFRTVLSAVAGTSLLCTRSVTMTDGAANVLFEDLAGYTLLSPAGGSVNEFFEVEIPLHNLLTAMPNGSAITRQFFLGHTVATFTFSSQSVRVLGWRMGQ